MYQGREDAFGKETKENGKNLFFSFFFTLHQSFVFFLSQSLTTMITI
jgi:hypothetical protein